MNIVIIKAVKTYYSVIHPAQQYINIIFVWFS